MTAKRGRETAERAAAEGKAKPRSPSVERQARGTARAPRRAANGGKPERRQRDQPHGRDEIVESVIDATLLLWETEGPATLSLRGIARRAGVSYGLVYRHFGTKDAVIRAAMNKRLEYGLQTIAGCEDLMDVMGVFLDNSTGFYARLLAWATLQYVLEDILPPEDLFIKRLLELAEKRQGGRSTDGKEAKVVVGSLIAMAYGWRLFESYLVPELGLEDLDRAELDSLVRDLMTRIIGDAPR